MKSYFNGTWEGVISPNTTGKDNAIGSTRSFIMSGILPMTEEVDFMLFEFNLLALLTHS